MNMIVSLLAEVEAVVAFPTWQVVVVLVILAASLAASIWSTVRYYKNGGAQELAEQETPVEEPVQEPVVEESATEEPAPVATVAEEPAPAPVAEEEEDEEEEAEEESEAEEDADESGEMIVGDKVVVVRYSKSFTAKLCNAKEETKDYYARIANEILSYRKVTDRVSWAYASFKRGYVPVAKMTIRGKTLCLYLAINPAEVADKYHAIDVSSKKKYAATPCLVKVKSARGVKFAFELIAATCEKLGIPRSKEFHVVSADHYPADTTENLIEKGLIKVKAVGGEEITEDSTLVVESFSMRKPE